MKRFLTILLLGFSVVLSADCTVQQTVTNGNIGPVAHHAIGQRFIACETGTLQSLSIDFFSAPEGATIRVDFFEGDTGWNNLIWTIDSIYVKKSGMNDGSLIRFNADQGNGKHRKVEIGRTYSFRITRLDKPVFFRSLQREKQDKSTEEHGNALNHFGEIINKDFIIDLSFSVHIEQKRKQKIPPHDYFPLIAEMHKNRVELLWSTAQNNNNYAFEVERSTDGFSWKVISFVPGNDSLDIIKPQYHCIDFYPAIGSNFYRVVQYGLDGTHKVSDITQVHNEKPFSFQISPNPASNYLNVDAPSNASVSCYDDQGKQVVLGKVLHGNIDISTLNTGSYVLTVRYKNRTKHKRFIKI